LAERGRSGAKAPTIRPFQAQRNFGRGLAGAGAYGQLVWSVFAPTQLGIEQDGVRRPGEFRQVSHQLTAHKRRRVFGTGNRKDSERQHVKAPLAVLQRIANTHQTWLPRLSSTMTL
jgi:hypothetical protein